MDNTKLTILDNGLRVITDYAPTVESAALGFWVGTGTRNENMAENGVSHMVEHMLFKGTRSRTSAEISQSVESVGGQMNAYTSREVTAYYAHLMKDDVPLAVDVLSDMVLHSTMPEEEVKRERQVVLQEIGMTDDTPDDLVFDLYQQTAYPDQALGAPILGTTDIIGQMSRDTMLDYVNQHYAPDRLVFAAAGNVDHDAIVMQVDSLFSAIDEGGPDNIIPAVYKGGENRLEKELEQSHLVLGFEGVSRHDEKHYYTMATLSTILGGGMSSRLFQEVREKRGLVYSVFSTHYPYYDSGQLMIYAGTGPNDLPELVPVLCDELGKMTHTVIEEELNRAKVRLKSSMLMAQESMRNRATQHAKHLLFHDDILDINKKIAKLESVTIDDVHKLAEKTFKTPPTVSAIGPLSKLENYDQLTSRLAA